MNILKPRFSLNCKPKRRWLVRVYSIACPAGRLRVPQDLCNFAMDNNCPIAMLLPSTTGMGVCSMSLLFFLVNTHNGFLGTYRSATNQERYRDLLLFSEIFSCYASSVWCDLW